MITSTGQFEEFVALCKGFIADWNLDNWDVHFRHKHNTKRDATAWILRDVEQMSATICLAKDVPNTVKIDSKEMIKIAKHEVAHLLVGEIAEMAIARYITESEFYSAEERLVNKICKLL